MLKNSKLLVLFGLVLVLFSCFLGIAAAEDEEIDYTLNFECEKRDLESEPEVDEDDIWNGEETESVEDEDHSEDADSVELDDEDKLVMDALVRRAFRGSYFTINAPCGARISVLNPSTTAPTFTVFRHGPRCDYRFYTFAHPRYFYQYVYFTWPGFRDFAKINIY